MVYDNNYNYPALQAAEAALPTVQNSLKDCKFDFRALFRVGKNSVSSMVIGTEYLWEETGDHLHVEPSLPQPESLILGPTLA